MSASVCQGWTPFNKVLSRERVSLLFPPPSGERNHTSEENRGQVREHRNADEPTGLLRALFDDQVHDSRAWFMYAQGRETLASYFTERVVFFGDKHRRDLALALGRSDTLLADGSPATADPSEHGEAMDAEQLAQFREKIDADWQAFYADTAEVSDAPV